MKKLKLILPMLAFIFAIGMSFAFVDATPEDYYATGFIQLDGTWYQVDVDCDSGLDECQVILEGDESQIEYPVFDAPNGNILDSPTQNPQEIMDPRT